MTEILFINIKVKKARGSVNLAVEFELNVFAGKSHMSCSVILRVISITSFSYKYCSYIKINLQKPTARLYLPIITYFTPAYFTPDYRYKL